MTPVVLLRITKSIRLVAPGTAPAPGLHMVPSSLLGPGAIPVGVHPAISGYTVTAAVPSAPPDPRTPAVTIDVAAGVASAKVAVPWKTAVFGRPPPALIARISDMGIAFASPSGLAVLPSLFTPKFVPPEKHASSPVDGKLSGPFMYT